jgi:uncharacterized membrane protein YgcG
MPRADEARPDEALGVAKEVMGRQRVLMLRTGAVLGAFSVAMCAWQFSVYRHSQLDGCDGAMELVVAAAVSHLAVAVLQAVTLAKLWRGSLLELSLTPGYACLSQIIGLYRLAVLIWAIVVFAKLSPSGDACRAAWDLENDDVWKVVQAEFALFCIFGFLGCCVAPCYSAAQAKRIIKGVEDEKRQQRQQANQQGGDLEAGGAQGGGGGDGGSDGGGNAAQPPGEASQDTIRH